MEKIRGSADNEVDTDITQQSVVRSRSASFGKGREEDKGSRQYSSRSTRQIEDAADHDEIEEAQLNRQVQVSIMLPQYLEDQVMLVKTRRRYKTKSAAFVYVLNRGLESIVREQTQPDRIEDMVVRTEHMTMDVLALLRLLVPHVIPDIDAPELQIERARIIEEMEGRGND